MAGVLNFSQYLGGPDQVNIEQVFPSSQNTLQYNFGVNIDGWSFEVEQQAIVVDIVTFDRNTGQPNFANSKVIGYFPALPINESYINITNVVGGIVNITLPADMYTGPILPDARQNVPITVVSVQWTDAGTPPQINSHRWAFINCWEPTVVPGDPTIVDVETTGYTAIV
jgi:hypothetical protein